MDICFENRYFATKEMIREYVNKVICKKLNISALALTAFTALGTFRAMMGGDTATAAILGAICIITLSVFLFVPPLSVKEIMENDKALHGDTPQESVIQFGDRIKIVEGSISMSVEYEKIFKIYDLHYSYVLMFGKRNGIMLKKDGFSMGDFNEFKLFISAKCKGVKLKLRNV